MAGRPRGDRCAARGRHLPPGARPVLVRADPGRPVRHRRHHPAGARAARHLADRAVHVRDRHRPAAALAEHRDRLPPRRGCDRDRPAARARTPDHGPRPGREEGGHPGGGRDGLLRSGAARPLPWRRAGAVAGDHPAADAAARAARGRRAVARAGRSHGATTPGGGTGPAAGTRPGRRPHAAVARAAPGHPCRSAARGGRGGGALLGCAHPVPPRSRSLRGPAGPGADDARGRRGARHADAARRTTRDAGAGRDPVAPGAVAACGLEPRRHGDARACGGRHGRRRVRHRRPHRADRPRGAGAAGPRGRDAAGTRHRPGRGRRRAPSAAPRARTAGRERARRRAYAGHPSYRRHRHGRHGPPGVLRRCAGGGRPQPGVCRRAGVRRSTGRHRPRLRPPHDPWRPRRRRPTWPYGHPRGQAEPARHRGTGDARGRARPVPPHRSVPGPGPGPDPLAGTRPALPGADPAPGGAPHRPRSRPDRWG